MGKPRWNTLLGTSTVVALMSGVSSIANAQSQDFANNESIFIDGKSLKITRGQAKNDVSAEVKKLSARELGSGTLIFRSGDKLYIADAPPVYAVDPSEPRNSYIPDRQTQVYAADANSQRGYYNPDRQTQVYAADPNSQRGYYNPDRQTQVYAVDTAGERHVAYINDPDYVYYRMKKAFEDTWVPKETK